MAKFCQNCGAETNPNAVVCLKCGVSIGGETQTNGKDWLTTLLLCFFLGYLGVDRFYTGSTGLGVGKLLTFGGCGIWNLIDFIMILSGSYKDGNGNPLVKGRGAGR